jgi:ABC-type glycerol-3-phosphate transport system substrate-binding protein
MMLTKKPMRRRLIAAGVLLAGVALAACGSGGGPSVQARQSGESTTTTAEPSSTTAEPATTAATPPSTTEASPTAPAELPCTLEALTAAYTAKFGNLNGGLQLQKCVEGWATTALTRGFDPPVFTLYRAEGDHWIALDRGGGKLCDGQGVPPDVAPQIGCET